MAIVKLILWHLMLAALAAAIAAICLFRIPGGWGFEPLIWLTLVWLIVIEISDDLIGRRGSFRLGRILFVVTLFTLIVLFPFTGIRLTHERALLINSHREEPLPLTRPQWNRLWSWHRLMDDRLIPKCLLWRVCLQGQSLPQNHKASRAANHLNEYQLSRMALSPALAAEVRSIGLDVGSRIKLSDKELHLLGENLRRMTRLDEIRVLGEHSLNRAGFPLAEIPAQPRLKKLVVWSSTPIPHSALERWLASPELSTVTFGYNQIDDHQLGSIRLVGEQLSLSVNHSTLSAKTIASWLRDAKTIRFVSLSPQQLSAELLDILSRHHGGMELAIIGDRLQTARLEDSIAQQIVETIKKAQEASSPSDSFLVRLENIDIDRFLDFSTIPRTIFRFSNCILGRDILREVANDGAPWAQFTECQVYLSDLQAIADETDDPLIKESFLLSIAAVHRGIRPTDVMLTIKQAASSFPRLPNIRFRVIESEH